MRCLFITSTRIGDAVLSTGLLEHLLKSEPELGTTVACGAPAAPLFGAVPGLAEVIVLDKRPCGLHWVDLWRQCFAVRWDIVVDLRRTAVPYLLFTDRHCRAPHPQPGRHRVAEVAAALGLDDPPAPRLWLTDRDRAAAARLIPSGAPVLALGPAANWTAKEWRPERFVELARRLTGPGGILSGARTAVFAAPHERARAQPVIDALPADRRLDLVGAGDLPAIAACLARCALFVGNDSGLMHLAAAAGTPTLGLFGPSPDARYGPWGRHTAVARTRQSYRELVEAPGFDHRKTETLMDGLAVGEAAAAAEALWRRLPGKAA